MKNETEVITPKKKASPAAKVLLVLIFILIGKVFYDANERDVARNKAVAAVQAAAGPEKTYFAIAYSYLKTANAQQSSVAKAMAGLTDGSTTLNDVKEAIGRAASVENFGYVGDYKNNLKNIPPSGVPINADIEETHRLFQSSMTELLQYWKDSNNAHLASGTATMKKCIEKTNHAVSAANTALAGLK